MFRTVFGRLSDGVELRGESRRSVSTVDHEDSHH